MIIITPHLSLWGNARTRATFPNHKKSDNPHPQGGGGTGVKMGTLHCAWWGGLPNPIIWNPFSCRNKKPTPSNVIGSLMIIRVLPIHVPPCYGGGDTLGPTPLQPYMIYDDHLVWPIHVPRRCEPWSLNIYHYEAMQGQWPHFLPTRTTTIHIHRGERGKGVKMGTLHWVGVGGGPAKPGSYILPKTWTGWFQRWESPHWNGFELKTTHGLVGLKKPSSVARSPIVKNQDFRMNNRTWNWIIF